MSVFFLTIKFFRLSVDLRNFWEASKIVTVIDMALSDPLDGTEFKCPPAIPGYVNLLNSDLLCDLDLYIKFTSGEQSMNRTLSFI